MTKREKTWFFPLCVYQPKINGLIFLVYFSGDSGRTRSAKVCHQFRGFHSEALCRFGNGENNPGIRLVLFVNDAAVCSGQVVVLQRVNFQGAILVTGGGKNNRTLHDAVFRQYLSQPDVARDFMMLHLPPALKAICQLYSLKLESGSFIDDDLRAYYSDVLYSLKAGGGYGVIYILIEHQSSPDRHMAFRLLRYAIAVMKRHLDLGHKTLPLVVPILFYQGKAAPYPYSLNWLEAFGDLALAHWLYTTPFPLVDITVIPDEAPPYGDTDITPEAYPTARSRRTTGASGIPSY